MEGGKDRLLQNDLEHIACSEYPFHEFYGSTILVTGATGLIGSSIVKTLSCMNRMKHARIKILAVIREMKKVAQVFSGMENHSDIEWIVADITSGVTYEGDINYIVHSASMTESKYFIDHSVETIDISLFGSKNMLELARVKKVKGFVYLSSMEVFGQTDSSMRYVREEDLGYINLLSVRSSYPESKRMVECMCACYAHQYGLPVRIARLSQTFGAGTSILDNRVFAQFARSVIDGRDIVLHTTGESVGNYCYTRDSVSAILLLLIRGESGGAYTVSNEESSISIRDMAYLVADKLAGNRIGVVFEIPEDLLKYGYPPKVEWRLCTEKIRSLGWNAEIGLLESYQRLLESFKHQMYSCEGL